MKKNRLKFVTNNFKNKRKRFKLIQFFPLWYFELSHLSWESRSWWKLGSGTMILFSRRVEVTGNFLLFWKLENPRDWNTRPSTFPLFVDSSFRLFLLKIQACQENTNMSRKYKHVKKNVSIYFMFTTSYLRFRSGVNTSLKTTSFCFRLDIGLKSREIDKIWF